MKKSSNTGNEKRKKLKKEQEFLTSNRIEKLDEFKIWR